MITKHKSVILQTANIHLITMASRTAVVTPNAPPPAPFMSQAIISNGLVFCSGSLGLDPTTGKFVEGDVSDRAVGTPKLVRTMSIVLTSELYRPRLSRTSMSF